MVASLGDAGRMLRERARLEYRTPQIPVASSDDLGRNEWVAFNGQIFMSKLQIVELKHTLTGGQPIDFDAWFDEINVVISAVAENAATKITRQLHRDGEHDRGIITASQWLHVAPQSDIDAFKAGD
jgi:hypothetical protein